MTENLKMQIQGGNIRFHDNVTREHARKYTHIPSRYHRKYFSEKKYKGKGKGFTVHAMKAYRGE